MTAVQTYSLSVLKRSVWEGKGLPVGTPIYTPDEYDCVYYNNGTTTFTGWTGESYIRPQTRNIRTTNILYSRTVKYLIKY